MEFERELAWLEERLGEHRSISFQDQRDRLTTSIAKENAEKEEADRKQKIIDEAVANGHGIECGCCFGDEILVRIKVSRTTHHTSNLTLGKHVPMCRRSSLLQRVHHEECRDETRRATNRKIHLPYPFHSTGPELTSHATQTITCMDLSGCEAPFPESELGRALSDKTFSLYHRLKQAKELELAAIEGLESCPSCPYSAIIENPDEKLFRCMNEICGQVTCRKCRRKEHIPKTCEGESDLIYLKLLGGLR